MSGKCCNLCLVAKVLVIIGALNWGLIGAFQYDLVMSLLGTWPMVVRGVYVLVGLAGVLTLIGLLKCCPKCCKDGGCAGGSCGSGGCC